MNKLFRTILFIFVITYSSFSLADYCSDALDIYQSGVSQCQALSGDVCYFDANNNIGPFYYLPAVVVKRKDTYTEFTCIYTCKHLPYVDQTLGFHIASINHSCVPTNEVRAPDSDFRAPACARGSVIFPEKRVVGEIIPIVGASFSMNYFTSWATGRTAEYRLESFLSSTDLMHLSHIIVRILDKNSNLLQSVRYGGTGYPDYVETSDFFTWSGLDGNSQETWGREKFKAEFDVFLSNPFPYYNVKYDVHLGNLKAKKLGLGGWVPSIWSFYDIESQTHIRGDGTSRKVTAELSGSDYRVAEIDGSRVYTFDSIGRVTAIQSGVKGATLYSFAYNSNGHLTSITEPFNRVTTFDRDSNGVWTSITAPNGKVTTIALNANGYLASADLGPNLEPRSERIFLRG